MSQLNLNVTIEFERDLRRYMKARGFTEKAAAIRAALRESVERVETTVQPADFDALLGIARAGPTNPRPRFRNRAALWEKG